MWASKPPLGFRVGAGKGHCWQGCSLRRSSPGQPIFSPDYEPASGSHRCREAFIMLLFSAVRGNCTGTPLLKCPTDFSAGEAGSSAGCSCSSAGWSHSPAARSWWCPELHPPVQHSPSRMQRYKLTEWWWDMGAAAPPLQVQGHSSERDTHPRVIKWFILSLALSCFLKISF